MSGRGPIRLTILAAALALGVARPAFCQVGITGGYNRDYVSDLVLEDEIIEVELADGYHFGIFFNFSLLVFGIRPAIIYHRVNDVVIQTGQDSTRFGLDIIEIPLDLRLRIPIPILTPYLLGGAVVTFPTSSDNAIDESLTRNPWRMDVGFGFEIDIGIRLWPEVRFGYMVTDLFKNEIRIGQTTISPTKRVRLDSFMVRLGVSF